jgi:hypothetical protein
MVSLIRLMRKVLSCETAATVAASAATKGNEATIKPAVRHGESRMGCAYAPVSHKMTAHTVARAAVGIARSRFQIITSERMGLPIPVPGW